MAMRYAALFQHSPGTEELPVKRHLRTGCVGFALLILLAICAVLTLLVYQARRLPERRPEYVALGSSFAAGAGLGPLQDRSPFACARSIGGYPPRLARLLHLEIVDMSCGGAVADHLLHGGQFFQGPQIRAITAQTRLVTITVGGNDVGYAGDLSMLAARHTDTLFGRAVRWSWSGPRSDAARDYAGLERRLIELIAAVHAKAPVARVVVATYPAIVPADGTCSRLGLSAQEAATMHEVGERLAQSTIAAAGKANALVVDMTALGRNHDACSAEPWTRGWTNGEIAPFHPTALGAEAAARAIAAALRAHQTE